MRVSSPVIAAIEVSAWVAASRLLFCTAASMVSTVRSCTALSCPTWRSV